MNENKVIIDGVDVSECGYYSDDDFCNNHYTVSLACSKNNCLFKQLKRKEQENKELKEQLEFSRTHKAVLDAERVKYKQALEEIREKLAERIAWTGQPTSDEKFILAKINEALK